MVFRRVLRAEGSVSPSVSKPPWRAQVARFPVLTEQDWRPESLPWLFSLPSLRSKWFKSTGWSRNRTQTLPLWFESQAVGRASGRAALGPEATSVAWEAQVSSAFIPHYAVRAQWALWLVHRVRASESSPGSHRGTRNCRAPWASQKDRLAE